MAGRRGGPRGRRALPQSRRRSPALAPQGIENRHLHPQVLPQLPSGTLRRAVPKSGIPCETVVRAWVTITTLLRPRVGAATLPFELPFHRPGSPLEDPSPKVNGHVSNACRAAGSSAGTAGTGRRGTGAGRDGRRMRRARPASTLEGIRHSGNPVAQWHLVGSFRTVGAPGGTWRWLGSGHPLHLSSTPGRWLHGAVCLSDGAPPCTPPALAPSRRRRRRRASWCTAPVCAPSGSASVRRGLIWRQGCGNTRLACSRKPCRQLRVLSGDTRRPALAVAKPQAQYTVSQQVSVWPLLAALVARHCRRHNSTGRSRRCRR